MRGCIHHHALVRSIILWELGPFTATSFCFAKHFSGTGSHKYLLTSLCFLCFSKLNLLLMIECDLDAFDVESLTGVSTWEFFKITFLWWCLLVYHDLLETVLFQQDLSGMSCFLSAGKLLQSDTGNMQSQGSQQLYYFTSVMVPAGFSKWETPFWDFWNSGQTHFWNFKNLQVKKVHFTKPRAISRFSIR